MSEQTNDLIPAGIQESGQSNFQRMTRPGGNYGGMFSITVRIPDSAAASAANYTTPFFIADRQYEIIDVFERHETASGAGVVDVLIVPSGTVPSLAAALTVLEAGLDLTTAANTNQRGTLRRREASSARSILARGDALALVTTGVIAALRGIAVTVILKAA